MVDTLCMPQPQPLDEASDLLAVLRSQLTALRAENSRLHTENATLRERIRELEARLGQHSGNSSRPPSADPPQAPPRPTRPPTGRWPGAQPGHVAHRRPLVPLDQVDHCVEHWPTTCPACETALPHDPALAVGDPQRHQVTELPPVRATITEHRLYRVRCPHCRQETRATLPPAVPTGACGPRLQATVSTLSGRYRLSRREVAELSRDVLGAPLAVGSVDKLCQATSAALAALMEELHSTLPQAPVVHADETGWKQAGQRRVLWVVVTHLATVFSIATSRGSQVLKDLLGEPFVGYLVSDRWSAYGWVPVAQRQVCWSHLARNFQGLGGARLPQRRLVRDGVAHPVPIAHALGRGAWGHLRGAYFVRKRVPHGCPCLAMAGERGPAVGDGRIIVQLPALSQQMHARGHDSLAHREHGKEVSSQ